MNDARLYGNYFGALKQRYTSPYETGELKSKKSFYVVVVKRILDILISLPAVLITTPINIVLAVITYLNVGSPIFFSHYRPGLEERPIKILKFRNMTNKTDEKGNLLPPSQRVTKVGAFLRKTSLDELFQFWLILAGKMSVIGPRPLLMCYLPEYTLEQHKRHSVKPGLECPLPTYLSSSDWTDRIENDLWYVENVSFKTDVIMFLRLFKLVFNSGRSVVRGEKIDSSFHQRGEIKQ